MKIALAQINVKAGYPELNFTNMKEKIEKAKTQEVDVIAFSEMCIGGYLIGDLFLNDEYCRYLMSFNKKVKELSDGIIIIYGNIYLEERNSIKQEVIGGEYTEHTRGHDGRRIRYNAAYAYYNKKALRRDVASIIIPEGIQPKILLPNYRYFDDKRYFYSPKKWGNNFTLSESVSPFSAKIRGEKVKIGVQLCEDMWCEDYRDNPAMGLAHSDIIINLSASPWTYKKNKARDRRVLKLFDWKEIGAETKKD